MAAKPREKQSKSSPSPEYVAVALLLAAEFGDLAAYRPEVLGDPGKGHLQIGPDRACVHRLEAVHRHVEHA